ncbi:heterokaryon incompatibility protein-domain-containing protein, partial [Paraphoma chrysanthemicola]
TQRKSYDNFYTPQNQQFYATKPYAALEARHIRLLRIHPLQTGEDNHEPIRCELLHNVSLDAMRGKYTTISYCAGDPKQTEAVFLDERPFNAFASLGHALRQARHYWKKYHEHQELLLWADQTCINQSDSSERGEQVSLMGDIYGAGAQVLISLSKEGDQPGGLKWLKNFSNDMIRHHGGVAAKVPLFDTTESECHQASIALDWETFRTTFLSAPWWTRAWVQQELFRASHAVFLLMYDDLKAEHLSVIVDGLCSRGSGKKTLATHDACQTCLFYELSPNPLLQEWRLFCVHFLLKRKHLMRGIHTIDQYPDLLDNIFSLSNTECTASDPRDLIYSCLGYSGRTYGVQPDYSPDISLIDAATQLARNVIEQTGNLDMLTLASRQKILGLQGDHPSWVADWSLPFPFYGRFRLHGVPLFAGILFAFEANGPPFAFEANELGQANRILRVHGILHETLHEDSMLLTDPFYDHLKPGDEVWHLCTANQPYVFRLKGKYRELVGREIDPKAPDGPDPNWIKHVNQLFENNDARIQCISIC